ncbi:MAG: potassium channel family protein [Candidatus Nanoarchaeia archaeon]
MHNLKATDVIKQFKILIMLIAFTLLFGIVGFLVKGYNISGAAFLTIEALAGKNPLEHNTFFVLSLNLFGAIIIWFAIWSAFALAIEGRFGEFLKEAKMVSEMKKLHDHYIICGAGRVGENIGLRLVELGQKVVFIEKDKDTINRLRAKGLLVYEVGPIEEHVLKEVGIEKAKGVAIALGDDSKNLLLTHTVRELNRQIKIAVRASDPKIIPKLKRAGADFVILPEAIGGIKLADALIGDVDYSLIFTNKQKYLV